MNTALLLGNGNIDCRVHPSRLKAHTYEGRFEDVISDASASEFWHDYERAVNDLLLSEVELLERHLLELPFFVLIGDRKYHASEVDLQIYPSAGRLSLKLSKP